MGKVNGKGVRKWDLKAWQLLPRQVMEKFKKSKLQFSRKARKD